MRQVILLAKKRLNEKLCHCINRLLESAEAKCHFASARFGVIMGILPDGFT